MASRVLEPPTIRRRLHAIVEKVTGRRAAMVVLDLRQSGQAAAIAVDHKGSLIAWTRAEDSNDPSELVATSLEGLAVRPKTVRVLLGKRTAQVGIAMTHGVPTQHEIIDNLIGDGFEPLSEPATAAVCTLPDSWVVAACPSGLLTSLAQQLAQHTVVDIEFVVDQLALCEQPQDQMGRVEQSDAGLLMVVPDPQGQPLVRSLPPSADHNRAPTEIRKSLEGLSFRGELRVMGTRREELSHQLAGDNYEVALHPLPIDNTSRLPESLELAWCIAGIPALTVLHSSELSKLQESFRWSHRFRVAALAVGLVGALLVAMGWNSSYASREHRKALEEDNTEVRQQLVQLEQSATLAEDVQVLRTELQQQRAPWPRIAMTLDSLLRGAPEGVGYHRLSITEGALELEASSTALPAQDFDRLRWQLEKVPGLSNLSWQEPHLDETSRNDHLTFRAGVRDVSPSKPQAPRKLVPQEQIPQEQAHQGPSTR